MASYSRTPDFATLTCKEGWYRCGNIRLIYVCLREHFKKHHKIKEASLISPQVLCVEGKTFVIHNHVVNKFTDQAALEALSGVLFSKEEPFYLTLCT